MNPNTEAIIRKLMKIFIFSELLDNDGSLRVPRSHLLYYFRGLIGHTMLDEVRNFKELWYKNRGYVLKTKAALTLL